jgi:hypothetical protein
MRPQREWKEDVLETACERFERRLSEEAAGVHREVNVVRLEVANLRVDTTQQMARMHTSLLRWMFVFWIGQLMAFTGIVATVLRVAKLL